jgi:hypothetical protein
MPGSNILTDPIKQRGGSWTVFYFIVLLTVLQLFVGLFTNGFALSQEEAMWHYIGRNWFRYGLVPYSGGDDNKSPLFYVIFGLSDWLFGVNYWFPRVLGTIVQSVGLFYTYKIAVRISGKRAGVLTLSLYGLSVLWHGADGRYVSFTETYEVVCNILSFYFLICSKNKDKAFISGFIAAIGLGFRLSAIFVICTLLITSLYKGRKVTLRFCSGVLVGIGNLVLFVHITGINFKDIAFYMFEDNFGPGSINNSDLVTRMVQFHNMFFYSEIILFYPLILVYIFNKKKIDWLLLWIIFVFIGINVVGNYARVDMKELIPAVSLAGGLSLAHLINAFKISMRNVMLIIWICFSPKTVEPIVNVGRLFSGEFQFARNFCHEPYIEPDESASRQLGLWVKANTNQYDKVYVAGFGSQVQAYSERISPSIYFNVTQTKVAKQRLFQDLRRSKAEMILIPLFPEYKQWVDQDLRLFIDSLTNKNYVSVQCMFNYNVFRLKAGEGN